MGKEYPLYPNLSEQGAIEANETIQAFKARISDVIKELLGELYVDIIPHISSDSWSNYRNELMDGFKDYNNRLVQGEYDFKQIREKIYKDYREEIIKDLNQDMIKEIENLKAHIKRQDGILRSRMMG